MAVTFTFPRKVHAQLTLSPESKLAFRLLAELSVEVPDRLVEITEAIAQGTSLFRVDFNKNFTPGAVRATGSIEPSEFLLKLIAAATSDFDGDVKERFHEGSPV